MSLHVVLVQPEIPQNTGNIARTCAVTSSVLHLVGPLGFSLDDRYLKRAGLDYWHTLDIRHYENMEAFFAAHTQERYFLLSTKGAHCYTDVHYQDGDFLIFGRETAGLPEELLRRHREQCIRIPMLPESRSLNLSNAVAIVTFEALRQQGFPGLSSSGLLAEY